MAHLLTPRPTRDEAFLDVQRELERAGFAQGTGPFLATAWELRHPLSIPGPIYVADDDACGCGPDLAPNNIVQGDNADGEFLFRQPSSLFELGQIIEAGDANPVDAYAMDGHRHWTPTLVRAWWQSIQPERRRLHAQSDTHGRLVRDALGRFPTGPWPIPSPDVSAHWRRWLRYIDGPAELYLRRYCFLLEQGRAPATGDALPEL